MSDRAESFFRAYVVCALWSSTDESDEAGGEPFDANYSPDDIAPDALADMRADCAAFIFANRADLAVYATVLDWSHAGHDFWLTRNGHGAGFWDRVSGTHSAWSACDRLSDAARVYGDSNLYLGDDGRIYA